MNQPKRIIIAITGASGSIYAQNLMGKLMAIKSDFTELALIVTETGEQVWQYELSSNLPHGEPIKRYSNSNLFAPPASGSSGYDAMVIVPCSAGTLARIATGMGNNLLTRSANVILKERKPLILTLRETPYNLIHIENMQRVTQAGGIILPASPSFYSHPKNIDELVDTVTNRILTMLGIKNNGFSWGSEG